MTPEQALHEHTGYPLDEIVQLNETTWECGSEEWLVLTDEEADALQDEYLESYLDDCIYPQLPELARSYFDEEAWKRDAKYDGRGHFLASYDGEEIEEMDLFLYRIN